MIRKMVVHAGRAGYDVLIDRTTKWGNPLTHNKDRRTLAKFVVATRARIPSKLIEAFEESHEAP